MCLNMTQPLYDLNAEDFETNSEEILIGFGGFLNYMPCWIVFYWRFGLDQIFNVFIGFSMFKTIINHE